MQVYSQRWIVYCGLVRKSNGEAIFRSTPGSSLIDISSGWPMEPPMKSRELLTLAGISNYRLLRITVHFARQR